MTFTYNPVATDLDKLRFALGDTDSSAPARARLEDEELSHLIADRGSWEAARVPAAETLVLRLSRLAVERSIGETVLKWAASRVEELKAHLARWRGEGARPTAGGIDAEPYFTLGVLDHPK